MIKLKNMVKITVENLNFGKKEIELKTGNVEELLKQLKTNDDAVILVGENGEIYTKDKKIKDGSKLNLIEVFSGG